MTTDSSAAPFFSVITASFNSAETIADSLESILSQERNDVEYIIVDGGSKDHTVDVIKSYEPLFAKKGVSLRWISEPDRGIYDAWNKGVSMARGTWISFIGSDDYYVPGALDRYSTAIQQHPDANYISSKVELIDSDGHRLRVFGNAFTHYHLVRDMDTAQVGSFHKRDLLDQAGPFSLRYKIVGDLEFYIRASPLIRSAYIADITAKMRDGGVSNHIYPALREALQVKLDTQCLPSPLAYWHFYFSLTKCYIKAIIGLR